MASILLVEDDPMISEIYKKKLEQSGYEVVLSVNGEDALGKMRAHTYDLVLLDLVLPGMDGVGVLKEVSQAGERVLPSPVVVFSNLNDSENQEAAFRFGASGFIAKSQFNPTELLKEVERYIRESSERKKNQEHFASQEALSQKEQMPPDDSGSKHVLFVEDEEVFINLFAERLKKEGYRVTVAETGAEALRVVEEQNVDILVTDMLLPVMRGDELITQVRGLEHGAHIPIVVISASATDEQVAVVKNMSIQGFFIKTRITPSELADHIRQALREE